MTEMSQPLCLLQRLSAVWKNNAEVSNLISLAEFKALANLCYPTLHSELSPNSFVLLSAI